MRTIRIIEHMSLDGVIQAPGGPNEDPPYPYGGWAGPHADPDGGAAIVAAHGKALDLLLGRWLSLSLLYTHHEKDFPAHRALCERESPRKCRRQAGGIRPPQQNQNATAR
jgi:hypothetical protein